MLTYPCKSSFYLQITSILFKSNMVPLETVQITSINLISFNFSYDRNEQFFLPYFKMKRYWFGLFCSLLLLFVYYSFIYTRSEWIFFDGICYYYNVVQCIFTYPHLICGLLNHVNWKEIRFISGFIAFEHLVTIPNDGYFSFSTWKVQNSFFEKIICILFLCKIPIA